MEVEHSMLQLITPPAHVISGHAEDSHVRDMPS